MNEESTAGPPAYTRNRELFAQFYDLQGRFAHRLAGHPGVVRAWLEALPPRESESSEWGESARAARPRRTARLSAARRRELGQLLSRAEGGAGEAAPLGRWLLDAVPVCTYLEIAEFARPTLRAMDPAAHECHRELVRQRTALFLANYGLAHVAAQQRRRQEYADQLSAASCGLLDAIDRYVPDDKAARFGYFAGYWIRYHLGRHAQKCGSTVSVPINQHRIGRRIDRYRAQRQTEGRPAPSAEEICADLAIGRDTYYWYQRQPRMMSLHRPGGSDGTEETALEHCLCDPAPAPADALEEAETAAQLRVLFRARTAPATRVMLAYVRCLGGLADAAEDYLASLQESALERIRNFRRF